MSALQFYPDLGGGTGPSAVTGPSLGYYNIKANVDALELSSEGNINLLGRLANTSTSIQIGFQSGLTGQQANTIAIGTNAGQTNQGTNSIAIGSFALGQEQFTNSVSVGCYVAKQTQGIGAVAVGQNAGRIQLASAVAVGQNAGAVTQGTQSVAVGYFAGNQSQGNSSIAIGWGAGQQSQGVRSVAIGLSTANTSQSSDSIAIGNNAGFSTQGNTAIAIGYQAGYTGQGVNSIAIGNSAGSTGQNANTIILNASGQALTSDRSDALFIAPIRNTGTASQLYYDPTSKEVTYALGGAASAPIQYLYWLANSTTTYGNFNGGTILNNPQGSLPQLWTIEPYYLPVAGTLRSFKVICTFTGAGNVYPITDFTISLFRSGTNVGSSTPITISSGSTVIIDNDTLNVSAVVNSRISLRYTLSSGTISLGNNYARASVGWIPN